MNSKAKNQNPKSKIATALISEIAAHAQNKETQTYAQKLLVELCQIDTTPNPDISIMRDAENRCFEVLERELKTLSFANGRLERRPD